MLDAPRKHIDTKSKALTKLYLTILEKKKPLNSWTESINTLFLIKMKKKKKDIKIKTHQTITLT